VEAGGAEKKEEEKKGKEARGLAACSGAN